MLHYGDLSDTSNLVRIIQECQPDEIYNLGAQSQVAVSFESPELQSLQKRSGIRSAIKEKSALMPASPMAA